MATIPAATTDARTTDDATIESILRALDPMMAYQRKAMLRIWQDKSVSKLHMFVLMLLENHGPLTMSRLAALVDVSLSNLTGIVDRMEQHGLVERVRDDRDRRLVLVRATASGVVALRGDGRTSSRAAAPPGGGAGRSRPSRRPRVGTGTRPRGRPPGCAPTLPTARQRPALRGGA